MKRTGLLLQLTIFGLCSYLIMTVNTQEIVSDAICNSITFPITGSISYARDSPSPLKFKLQSRSYKPSTPFNIVISSSQKIQSFYMQAFQPGSAQPVGFFVYKYSDDDVIVSDCPTENEARELGKSTLSDPNDFRPRKQISIYWTSNNTVTGLVVFKITATTEDQVVWSGLTSYEVTSSVKECITGSGSDYRGTVAHTVDDVPCQRWDSQTPHRQIVGNKYDFTVSDFCRNPDKDDSPWCFLSRNDTGKRFGKCNIRKCTDAIDEMVEFGVPNGDTPIPLTNDSSQVIPLTFPLHLVSKNYTHFKVFGCGVIAMGTSASVLQSLEMDEEAEVKSSKFNASLGHVMAFTVFWSKIDRTDSDIGSGHVYFRQSNKESDLRLVSSTMGPLIRRKLNNESSEFTAKWVFIATWYLVGDKKNSENTFQSIIVTDKQRTFLMYDFDMTDDWEDEAKALIGYSEGDGFQFLNKTTPSSLETRFEQADQLSVSATSFSNVNDTGKWLYDISPCARQLENGHEKCEKTLTLVLGTGKSVPKITTVSVPPEDSLPQCENGGTPIQGGENGYACACPDGFTGELCEINIDECNSNPCNNNATCEDGINSFKCRCKSGFTGILCDSDINECISNPCINGGVCKSLINDYECRCPVLYTGKNCENYQDPCIQEEDFCKNGGTCVSNGTVLGCKCGIGFSGKTCEQVIPVTTRSTEEYACPSDRTGSDINGYIYWEPVAAGLQQTAFCPNPTNGIATRQCTEFGWLSPNESFCYRLSESSQKILKLFEAEINEDNVEEMADQLATVTGEFSNELTAYDIKNVAIIVKKLISATASSIAQPTATGVIKSVSNVMFAPEYEIEHASMNSTTVTDLATTVEETLAKVETIGGNVLQINSENLLTAVAPVNDISTFTGQYFSFSVDTRVDVGGGHRYIDELGSDVRAAINIPASLALEATEPLTRIQCAVYTSKALFQNVDTSKVRTNGSMDANIKLFGDYVISGKVGNQPIQNLSEKITIIISNLQTNYYGGERLCAYLETENGGINASSGSWLTDGCIVVSSTSTHTVMETDHLTNFAVIMDVYGTTKKLGKTHLMILQIVTTVGCSVSIFGLFCTLLSYLLFEKLRKDNPSKILISFCIALMFLNTVFLCLQPSYLSGNKIVCKAVACILHYFLLSTLMWMGIEAINMYFALVKVFNIYYRRYILKVSLIGWGVPGIFLGATFVTEKLTGLESYQVFEYNEICWLRTPLFYGTLVGPFGFVFLANCIIYYLVLRQILGMSSRKLGEQNSRRSIKQNKKESFRRLRGAIGIMVLLGLSWGFAFVMIESATLLFAYIFVAANSSQGFWIFLFHCYLKQEVVVAWKRLLFKKGSFMRDGSANRWSRWSASSSATRGSRLINSSSARSLSALATKPHPYLVPRFENVDQREKSVGPSPKMTENLLEEMGYVNNSFTDMNEIGPPPSMPPPSPPGYWDENTKRLVRKVPKKVGNIEARTICTQTTFPDPSLSDSMSNSDASSDLSHDSFHQEDMLHGHSVRVGCETDSNVENELQDSVGEHFVRPFSLPMHWEVAMSPSNESGVYSDTSASNQPSVQQRQLEEHFATLEHLEAPPDMNNLHSGNVELSTVTNSSDPPRTNLVQANGSIKGRYNNVLSEYHQKYAQIQGRRISQKHYNHIPIVVTNGDTSSTAYCSGTESRGSMSSQASSSDYENKNETNFKSWQPPLVIKRSDNVAEENGKESPISVNKFRKLNKNHSTDQFKLKKSKGSRANSPPVKRKHRLKKRNAQSTLS